MYARNASTAQYGPSGAFAFEEKPVISCANPLLTAQEVATICTPANLTANQTLYGLPRFSSRSPDVTLRLGYGNVPVDEIPRAVCRHRTVISSR
jgi:hypothetical protein